MTYLQVHYVLTESGSNEPDSATAIMAESLATALETGADLRAVFEQ